MWLHVGADMADEHVQPLSNGEPQIDHWRVVPLRDGDTRCGCCSAQPSLV
jgi:hypothetical protein